MKDEIGSLPLQPGGRDLARKKGLKSMVHTRQWDKVTASVNGGDSNLSIKDKSVKIGERASYVVDVALRQARQSRYLREYTKDDILEPEEVESVFPGAISGWKHTWKELTGNEFSEKDIVEMFQFVLLSDGILTISDEIENTAGGHCWSPEKQIWYVSSREEDLEEAMDIGKYPDHIDPEKRRRIEQGEHPYADNPAFPKNPGEHAWPSDPESHLKKGSKNISSYADLLASDAYPAILKKLTKYLGYTPNRGQAQRVMVAMQQAMQQVMQFEQGHEEELEQAAIETVLSLPHFEQARAAIEDGSLIIDAKLRPSIDLEAPVDAPEPGPELNLDVPEIASELNAEKGKRRMMNLMTQGAALNGHYAFHLASEKLNEIHPDLTNLYGVALSTAEFAYWIMPEDIHRAMMGQGYGVGGKARIEERDGQVIIHAQAIMFPVLIQEIIKGLMEYIAYDPDEEPEAHNYSREQTDTLGNEIWDTKFGPAVWQRVLNIVGHENQRWIPQLYQHLQSLSPGEFNGVMQGILQGDPSSKKYVDDLMAEIKQENGGGANESTLKSLKKILPE